MSEQQHGVMGGPVIIDGKPVDTPPNGYLWHPLTFAHEGSWKALSVAEVDAIIGDLMERRYPTAEALGRLLRGLAQLTGLWTPLESDGKHADQGDLNLSARAGKTESMSPGCQHCGKATS